MPSPPCPASETRRSSKALIIATKARSTGGNGSSSGPGIEELGALFFIAVPVLAFTRSRFPLTPLVYALILLHAIVLMVGGHYTYARVPLGFWLQEWFDFSRNHYDRIGHLAQGFIPAMVAREILLRQTPLQPGGWLFTLVTSVALAISAVYEFIEWWAALALGAGADEFLATQGDPFDTQADMLMATLGAMLAQALLARWHDRQLARLRPR